MNVKKESNILCITRVVNDYSIKMLPKVVSRAYRQPHQHIKKIRLVLKFNL